MEKLEKNMNRLTSTQRKTIYTMFANGDSVEHVAETMNISIKRAQGEYLRYLQMPLEKKLRMTVLPMAVASLVHRLADDFKDMRRLDLLLQSADAKSSVALLEMKRKIKARMAREFPAPEGVASLPADAALKDEVAGVYAKLFGIPAGQEPVQ